MNNETQDLKKEFEIHLADQYPGTMIKWDGDNPTLVIPDELIAQSERSSILQPALFSEMGGEVEFYPNKAVLTEE